MEIISGNGKSCRKEVFPHLLHLAQFCGLDVSSHESLDTA